MKTKVTKESHYLYIVKLSSHMDCGFCLRKISSMVGEISKSRDELMMARDNGLLSVNEKGLHSQQIVVARSTAITKKPVNVLSLTAWTPHLSSKAKHSEGEVYNEPFSRFISTCRRHHLSTSWRQRMHVL